MIRTHDAGHWLEVILDRPERRNALTGPMYEELADIIDQADQNQKYRALILTGAGEHFCAGNDISELSNVRSSTEPPPIKFLRSLVKADIPLIAAVEGHAVGIGVTLLLHADFVYAARDARLRMPFTALGLCPEGASSHLLAQYVGQRRANEWLLLSQAFSAEQAMEDGPAPIFWLNSRLLPCAPANACCENRNAKSCWRYWNGSASCLQTCWKAKKPCTFWGK